MPTSSSPAQIAVFGSSSVQPDEPAYGEARRLGAELARRGATVMTGGYDGAMAACSQGAHEVGGHVVGVTVEMFEGRGPVNRWVRERVHTETLFERLDYLVHRADGFVAVAGSVGTLTEVFLIWSLLGVEARKAAPLVLMGTQWHAWLDLHRGPGFVPERLFQLIEVADTPEEAADRVMARLASTVPTAGE
ncbi:MAG: LOG family protein [Candidatus Eisenbacteria bacterium]